VVAFNVAFYLLVILCSVLTLRVLFLLRTQTDPLISMALIMLPILGAAAAVTETPSPSGRGLG
jgi:hypothetical protein